MSAVDGNGELVVAVGAGGVIIEEQRSERRVVRLDAGAFADVWVGAGGEAYAVGEDLAVRSRVGLWTVLACAHGPLTLVDGFDDNVVAVGEAGVVRLTPDGCELLVGDVGGPMGALAVTADSIWLGAGSSVYEIRGGVIGHEGTLAPGHASYALVADGTGILLIGAELTTDVEAVRALPPLPTVVLARALDHVALSESATRSMAALPSELTDAWTDGAGWWVVWRGRLLVAPSRGERTSSNLAYRCQSWSMIQGFSGGFAASGEVSGTLALVMDDGRVVYPFAGGAIFGVSALTTDGESLVVTGHWYDENGTPSLGSPHLAELPPSRVSRAADVPEVAGGRACSEGEARAVSTATCCATSSTQWAVEPTGEVTRRRSGSTSRISVGARIPGLLVRAHSAVCTDDTLRFVTSLTSVTSCGAAGCDARELAEAPTGVAPLRTEVTGGCTLVIDGAGAAWVHGADAWTRVVAPAPVLAASASGRDLLLLHGGGMVTRVADGCL